MIVVTAVSTRVFCSPIIVGTIVPSEIVGTSVPTIIVLTAYY